MIFHRKNTKKNLKMGIALATFIFIGFIVLTLLILRGSEDDWICVKGEWIKHGVPSTPMPTSLCK
jgi:hypothetical protein